MATGGGGNEQLVNLQAAQLAAQVANWAAQLEFSKERLRLLELPDMQGRQQIEIDRLAFAKAQDTWQRALQESTTTGTFNGVPTTQWMTQQAQLTGVLNGQQTLSGALNAAQIAQMQAQMRLQNEQMLLDKGRFEEVEKARVSLEREQVGLQTQAQQAALTGMYGGQKTFERQRWEQEQATQRQQFAATHGLQREEFESQQGQEYLRLLSSLQGPGNAFKMARILQNSPDAIRSLGDAWAGKYQMGGQGGNGQNPGRAEISDLFQGTPPGMGYGGPGYGGGPPGGGWGPPPGWTPPVSPGGPPGAGAFPNTWNPQTGPAPGQPPQGVAYPGMPVASPGAGGYVEPPSRFVPPGYGEPPPAAPVPPPGGYPAPPMPYGGPYAPQPGANETGPAVPGATLEGRTWAYGGPAMGEMAGYTVSMPGYQAPNNAWNYGPTPSGQTQVYPPGVTAPVQETQISSAVPLSGQQAASLTDLVAPNKINAKNYGNTNTYMQKMGWAAYEDAGWDVEAAQDAFKKSLPKYAGPAQGRVRAT